MWRFAELSHTKASRQCQYRRDAAQAKAADL
jgi:hypothetical protein